MDSTTIAFILFAVFIVSIMVTFAKWHYSRADDILARWAEDNGYEIRSSERCWFKGPFFALNDQEVYYVTVRTTDGQLRRGWVRCGGWLFGVLSSRTDVRWDKRATL